MHTKKIFAIALSTLLLIPVSAQAATVNKSCAKAGQTSGSGSMKLTCKKVSGKLKWVSTPTGAKPAKSTKPTTPAAPKVGTFSSPVPKATFANVGSFKYRFDSSANDITSLVCEANGFNEGCSYDSNYNKIIDPKAVGRWVSITVTAVNTGQEIARPAGFLTSFELVLPNGKLLANYSTSIDEDLDAISLVPGVQASGVITFYLEKSISIPDLLVVRDRGSFTNSDTVYYSVPK